MSSNFKFDAVINIPTIIAVATACVALGGAVAVAQTNVTDVQSRVSRLEIKYETVPERLATLEADVKDTKDSTHRIERTLDRQHR